MAALRMTINPYSESRFSQLPIRTILLATPVMATMATDSRAMDEYRRIVFARSAPAIIATIAATNPPVHSEMKMMCSTSALTAIPWLSVPPEWLISPNGHTAAIDSAKAIADHQNDRASARITVTTSDKPVTMTSNRPRSVSAMKYRRLASKPGSSETGAANTVRKVSDV